jgi:hypothetical protein
VCQAAESSWDGRGRALDTLFVERLWRSVQYKEVYIKGYQTRGDAEKGLNEAVLKRPSCRATPPPMKKGRMRRRCSDTETVSHERRRASS